MRTEEDMNPSLHVVPPPRDLKGFLDAKRAKPKTPRVGGGLRARWKSTDGQLYEWDYQHGTVEVYDRDGNHMGECDPDTGETTKGPDRSRRIEP